MIIKGLGLGESMVYCAAMSQFMWRREYFFVKKPINREWYARVVSKKLGFPPPFSYLSSKRGCFYSYILRREIIRLKKRLFHKDVFKKTSIYHKTVKLSFFPSVPFRFGKITRSFRRPLPLSGRYLRYIGRGTPPIQLISNLNISVTFNYRRVDRGCVAIFESIRRDKIDWAQTEASVSR